MPVYRNGSGPERLLEFGCTATVAVVQVGWVGWGGGACAQLVWGSSCGFSVYPTRRLVNGRPAKHAISVCSTLSSARYRTQLTCSATAPRFPSPRATRSF